MTSLRSLPLLAAVFLSAFSFVAAQTGRVRFSEAVAQKNPAWKLDADTGQWRVADGKVTAEPAAGDHAAVAAYTVPAGGAGFYAIEDSSVRRDEAQPGRIALRVWVRRTGVAAEPAVATKLEAGEVFDFDTFAGYLDAGDTLLVGVGSDGDPTGDRTELDFTVVRTPAIAVTAFPEDFANGRAVEAPGGWSLAGALPAGSAAARQLAWGQQEKHGFTAAGGSARVALPEGADAATKETVASFRMPHSGYYALHDAWQNVGGGRGELRLYVGHESTPRRIVAAAAGGGLVSLNTDIGYVQKGELISLAFARGAGPAVGGAAPTVEFAGTLVEWAPRRAPLRVRRGADGLLDVYEPEAQRVAIDIPTVRWITVLAQEGDATEAIRAALAKAQSTQTGNDYTGVRLERGKTYVVGSTPTGGPGGGLFAVRGGKRLVFDGNGATLLVSSPELPRREMSVFSALNSRDVVFADFVIKATSIPFTTGEVLAINPPKGTTQTVTFRVTPGALDPVRDIARSGQADAYAYDPLIPGRLAVGTWTHFPGRGTPSLQATAEPGVFTHSVTRTGNSISVGDKWLVKNKRGGVIYFGTRGTAENITLSGVTGLASGGGHLRFSQTSGINILDCRFEPDGENWISSSADSIHGRGREGVWIENTLIRGICEDVMNTYGQTMVVLADEDAGDTVISLRMFDGGPESGNGAPVLRVPSAESALPGDQLLFFNPRTGQVLGHANVKTVAPNGRITLSTTISGIDTWETGDGKGATMVYNTRVAGRFFVRDSRIMDSMRFGIYIKARAGVVFNTQIEGLSGPSIFATNEPEWPEGPPATHLWVQGCTFSQNNYGYMPRNRAFMVVDPADISIYTRRLRAPNEPEGFRAHLTRGQYANSHVKLIGNVFHDWRGLGISVRNARNVLISDNLFLPPTEDDVMRQTLAKDPALRRDGRGSYAAVFLASVNGARVTDNRAYGLPSGDQTLVREADALDVGDRANSAVLLGAGPEVALHFSEWFGPTSVEAASVGAARDRVDLGGATHRAGRLGAGLWFDGKSAPAELATSSAQDRTDASQLSVALWIQPQGQTGTTQVVHAQGNRESGLVIALNRGRVRAGLWQKNAGAWLDLGAAATAGQWQHVALVYDGAAKTLRGFTDGLEVAVNRETVPAKLEGLDTGGTFGGLAAETRLDREREFAANSAGYRGGLDEFYRYDRALTATEISLLALRRPLVIAAQP